MTIAIRLSAARLSGPFVQQVEKISGQKLLACYQCGKCSAGCPMADYMDMLPNQIIRLAQLGMQEKLLASNAIWTCVSCMTCNSRCPKDVRIAEVIEAVRETVLRSNARNDRVAIADFSGATLAALPPIALVAGLRKLAS